MNTIENTISDNLLLLNPNIHVTKSQNGLAKSPGNLDRNGSYKYHPMNYDDPNSVKQFAYESCKEYLGGVWKKIRSSQFNVNKISGGLSNYLFLCSVSDNCKAIGHEPLKVLLRIYGENHHNNSSIILKDVVVSALMSDKGLGPKLYGILPIGRIEEYIPSVSLVVSDFYIPQTSRQIAETLAKFHTLEMPFVKEPKWLFDTTKRYLKQIETIVKFKDHDDIRKFNKLLSYNLENEFKILFDLLDTVKSPVVFCHNDLQPGNILKLHDDSLVVIDYEYGSYNYRGFDLGNHFCEWMMVNNYNEFPYFKCNPSLYPTHEQQLNFIRAYINEYTKIAKSDGSSEDFLNEHKILLEANYFALASHFFWTVWAICQAAATKITFSYLDYALTRIDLYKRQKEQLLKGILPPKLTKD